MNGFEACRAWRSGQGGASGVEIPVVFITGYDTHEGRLDGFDAGATEFHPKRFTPGELQTVVDRLLRGVRRFESMTVLAVDDSRTVRFMVRSVLRDLGCTMLMADSGEAALELLDQYGDEIDLVVSDQLMPGIGGAELCRRFRHHYGYTDVPFIVLSASVSKDKVVKLFDAGATDYISKPFIAEEFQARMASHLQNRMLSKQLQQYNLNLESRVELATTEIRTLADDLRSALDQERRLSIEKEKMGRFLPRHVVDEIHRNRERTLALGGKTMVATVLFSDICGFTRLAEGMEPTELVGFLNQYMTAMANEIEAEAGIIDKFVGDGIMAVFSDENHDDPGGLRGARAAVRMQFALEHLRKKWTNTRPLLSDVRMRIGVNTGTVVAGNVGTDTRMDYTVIGDTVNVASRLESKCTPGGVLISEACFEAAQRSIPVQSTDAIHVKNRQQAVCVHTIDIEQAGALFVPQNG